MTVHVAHALALAKAKGYKVPQEMIDKTKPYLKNVEKYYDKYYKDYSANSLDNFGLRALCPRFDGRQRHGKSKGVIEGSDARKNSRLKRPAGFFRFSADDKNSSVEVEAIKRFLMNRTTETAATANFVTDYGDGAWLIMYSNRRADGVLLEALIKADVLNKSAGINTGDLIPKLVRGLLDHRTKGSWSNTQENVFILLALDKYFNAFEKVTPDFVTKNLVRRNLCGRTDFQRSLD